jgi:hypothetical protein
MKSWSLKKKYKELNAEIMIDKVFKRDKVFNGMILTLQKTIEISTSRKPFP